MLLQTSIEQQTPSHGGNLGQWAELCQEAACVKGPAEGNVSLAVSQWLMPFFSEQLQHRRLEISGEYLLTNKYLCSLLSREQVVSVLSLETFYFYFAIVNHLLIGLKCICT